MDYPVGEAEPKVIHTDDDLLGVNRVVFDDVITDQQCQVLINLAQVSQYIESLTNDVIYSIWSSWLKKEMDMAKSLRILNMRNLKVSRLLELLR